MGKLYEKLTEYGKSDVYPYHMPGHKRNMIGRPFQQFYSVDITEIDGFDNLHQPEEILKDLQNRANGIYGAKETFLLVNGSTCGILSAVSATVQHGGKILIARNCHKSVYHAAYLKELDIAYICPKMSAQFGIALGVDVRDIEEELKKDSEIEAVLITSPTYEGVISDVEEIAKVVHKYHVPLIVDEAHGAHLGFAEKLPASALQAGADIVIHSLHKTLPSPTQTALLHVTGNLVNREKLRRYLRIYQSSSPSYPLMAGVELCLDVVENEGRVLLEQMCVRWSLMLERLKKCKRLHMLTREDVLKNGMKEFDVGKLVISTEGTGWTGQRLYEILLEKYHLQLEMATDRYVLAMFTLMDTEEGYERLTEALLEIDESIDSISTMSSEAEQDKSSCIEKKGKKGLPETICHIAEALDAEKQWVSIRECEGRTAADFINLYPPGIPVVVPGEKYDKQTISDIENWHRKQLSVQGLNEKMEVPVIAN